LEKIYKNENWKM